MPDALDAPPPTLARRIAAAPLTYGLKVGLVAVVSLYVAFLFDLDHTQWALLSVPLIVRPDGGNTVWRSLGRLVGTLIGCASGFAFSATFGQDPAAIVPAVMVYLVIVGYLARRQSGLDGYGYAIAGLVALVIVLEAGPDIDDAFGLTVARATETAIPVVVAFAVMLVVFPQSIADEARVSLIAARGAALSAVEAVLAGETGAVHYESAVLPRLALLNTALRALAFERNRRHHLRSRLNEVAAALNRVALSAETVRVSFARSVPGCTDARVVAGQRRLADALGWLPPVEAPVASRDVAAAGFANVAASLEPGMGAEAPGSPPEWATLHRLQQLAFALSDLMAAEATLLDPARPAPRTRPVRRRYADGLAALEGALRPALIFLVLASLWIVTAWPDGLVLTLIATSISLVLPVIVPRHLRIPAAINMAFGLLAGGVLALALMIVLAGLDGFGAFALVFGVTVGTIFAQAKPLANLPFAIGMLIALAVGFQPQNEPLYDPLALFNTIVALMLMPPLFVAAMSIVFPEDGGWIRRHLARATDRLLIGKAMRARTTRRDNAEDFFDVLSDYDLPAAPDDALLMHLRRRARSALLAGDALLEIAEVEAAGRIGAGLTALGRPLRTAVTTAARDGSGDGTVFADIRIEVGKAITGARGAARDDILRFGAAAELLAAIADTGWLRRSAVDAS